MPPFTSGDRVLVHLFLKGSRKGWTGGVSDQDDISTRCGVGRTHVPRALKPLIDDGLVIERIGRAPGKSRRVKVYSLTETGVNAAEGMLERVRSSDMRWTDDKGSVRTDSMGDALRIINDRISHADIPITLIMSLDKEVTEWNDILWLSSSIGGSRSGFCLPPDWAPAPAPEVEEGIPMNIEGREELDAKVSGSEFLVVAGMNGMGKRHLISSWAREKGRKVLWLTRSAPAEQIWVEHGGYDLVVLLDGADLDAGKLLISGNKPTVEDPRHEEWPDELRALPLIAVVDAEEEIEGPIVWVEGLDRDSFIEGCASAGLDVSIAKEYHAAVKGSPEAIIYLDSEGSAIKALPDDPEEALFVLLMGFRSFLKARRYGNHSKD